MGRYKKGTKACPFCGRRKSLNKFAKNGKYCLTCWRMYFKHLPPKSKGGYAGKERDNLLKMADMFRDNQRYRMVLYAIWKNDTHLWKELRVCLRNYGRKAGQKYKVETILEAYRGLI